MAINRQLSAAVGRPVRRNMTDVLRARSPMVYNLHQQRKDDEHADRMYQLEKDAQESREKYDEKNLKLAKKNQDRAQNRARWGQAISLGSAGAQIYFGNKQANATEEAAEEIGAMAKTPAARTPTGQKGGFTPAATPGPSPASAAPATGIWPSIKEGVSQNWGPIAAGGGVGYMAGKLVDSDDKWKNVAAGAGAGALTGWALSGGLKKLMGSGTFDGGNLVASAASGILGGMGGLFS